MTEKKLFEGYADLLRMSSPRYKPTFLAWLANENYERYVRFCKHLKEEVKHERQIEQQ